MPISEVFNEDNMIGMARYPDKFFDLAIVDPPYGIGQGKRQSVTYAKGKGGKRFYSRKIYSLKDWDNQTPDMEYFTELFRVSDNQIIWGGNYFSDKLPPSRGWVFWDKKISNSNIENYGDGELAWSSFDRVLKKFTYDWIGLGYLNNPQGQKRIHPTEKPWQLYKYLLSEYAQPGNKILDTHMGSQSSRIAAYQMGFDYYGWEIDKEYFEAGNKRFKEQTAQLKLL